MEQPVELAVMAVLVVILPLYLVLHMDSTEHLLVAVEVDPINQVAV
jgi:hypothetical protein